MNTMSERIPTLSDQTLSAEQQDILNEVSGARGRIPTPYKIWIHSVELARVMKPLGSFLTSQISLSKRQVEIAVLFLAKHWNAEYMFAVHAREAREAGVSEATIEAIKAGRVPELHDHSEQVAIDLLTALAAPNTPSDEIFSAGVEALGHGGVAELLALCGYFSAVGLATKLYAVPPPSR